MFAKLTSWFTFDLLYLLRLSLHTFSMGMLPTFWMVSDYLPKLLVLFTICLIIWLLLFIASSDFFSMPSVLSSYLSKYNVIIKDKNDSQH